MNRVVHFEINSPDPDRASSFYSEAFGWSIEKWEGPQDYWLVTTGEDGTVGINGYSIQATTPFGGIKQSGYGREGSRHAIADYSSLKNVYVDLS